MPDLPAQPLRLDYAQKEARTADATFRTAAMCGAVPFALESCIFLLWLITRWEIFLIAVLCVILIGAIFATGALIAVCINWFISRWGTRAPVSWWPTRREVLTVIFLLSNFLLSGAILRFAVFVI